MAARRRRGSGAQRKASPSVKKAKAKKAASRGKPRRAPAAPATARGRSAKPAPPRAPARRAPRGAEGDREPGDEVLAVFRHYDRDRSGSIDAKELAELLEALGAAPTEEELLVALDVVDRNRSGKISWPEFSAWWRGR